jgi:hypothetical protein
LQAGLLRLQEQQHAAVPLQQHLVVQQQQQQQLHQRRQQQAAASVSALASKVCLPEVPEGAEGLGEN